MGSVAKGPPRDPPDVTVQCPSPSILSTTSGDSLLDPLQSVGQEKGDSCLGLEGFGRLDVKGLPESPAPLPQEIPEVPPPSGEKSTLTVDIIDLSTYSSCSGSPARWPWSGDAAPHKSGDTGHENDMLEAARALIQVCDSIIASDTASSRDSRSVTGQEVERAQTPQGTHTESPSNVSEPAGQAHSLERSSHQKDCGVKGEPAVQQKDTRDSGRWASAQLSAGALLVPYSESDVSEDEDSQASPATAPERQDSAPPTPCTQNTGPTPSQLWMMTVQRDPIAPRNQRRERPGPSLLSHPLSKFSLVPTAAHAGARLPAVEPRHDDVILISSDSEDDEVSANDTAAIITVDGEGESHPVPAHHPSLPDSVESTQPDSQLGSMSEASPGKPVDATSPGPRAQTPAAVAPTSTVGSPAPVSTTPEGPPRSTSSELRSPTAMDGSITGERGRHQSLHVTVPRDVGPPESPGTAPVSSTVRGSGAEDQEPCEPPRKTQNVFLPPLEESVVSDDEVDNFEPFSSSEDEDNGPPAASPQQPNDATSQTAGSPTLMGTEALPSYQPCAEPASPTDLSPLSGRSASPLSENAQRFSDRPESRSRCEALSQREGTGSDIGDASDSDSVTSAGHSSDPTYNPLSDSDVQSARRRGHGTLASSGLTESENDSGSDSPASTAQSMSTSVLLSQVKRKLERAPKARKSRRKDGRGRRRQQSWDRGSSGDEGDPGEGTSSTPARPRLPKAGGPQQMCPVNLFPRYPKPLPPPWAPLPKKYQPIRNYLLARWGMYFNAARPGPWCFAVMVKCVNAEKLYRLARAVNTFEACRPTGVQSLPFTGFEGPEPEICYNLMIYVQSKRAAELLADTVETWDRDKCVGNVKTILISCEASPLPRVPPE